ncbi:MAG: cytochrome c biogenesis protein ResB [Clostridia bacterium]|nr:cytochrome c biogenesis protein ResB [Clostridia bacterium]
MKKIIRFLRSMQFGMILLALVIACSVAGSLIVQQREPMEYVNRYGEDAARLILVLKLNDVFSSVYFLVLMAALCLNLTLCSIVRLPRTMKAAKQLLSRAEAAPVEHPLTPEQAQKVSAYLKRSGYRLHEKDGKQFFVKNLPGFYGSFLTHLSFLLILVVGALAVVAAEVTDQVVMPGQTHTLKDGTTITVEAFQSEDETGLLDYASKIVMRSADGTKEAAKEIRVNELLSFEGYKVYQQTYGTAGSVRIDNLANGASEVMHLTESCFLTLNGVDGLFFQALYPGYIRAEDGSVKLITSTSGAYSDPVYDVFSVAEGSMAPVLAFPGETLTIGDVSFTFLEPTSYPGLRIKYVSPAVLGALYAVFVLMVAGLYLCFFMVPTAVALTEEGYAIVSPKPPTGLIIGLSACLEEEET